MAELHIGFMVRGAKTVSKIGKKQEPAAVIFKNEDTKDPLRLTISEVFLRGAKKPRKGHKRLHVRDVIPPQGTLTFDVRNCPVGKTFMYTAQIGASAPEDPIIIIER